MPKPQLYLLVVSLGLSACGNNPPAASGGDTDTVDVLEQRCAALEEGTPCYDAVNEFRDDIEALQNQINEMANSIVPTGTVVMWSSALSNVPAGWALCDGTNSTPDLRDRFIVGHNDGVEPGETGGEHSTTLTTAQLPPHNHPLGLEWPGGAGWPDPDDNTGSGQDYAVMSGIESTHCCLKTGSEGNADPIDNRPAFYRLAFIMKL